jgi:hypothetical protein
MNILVTSPLPLPMNRAPEWGVNVLNYDSGLRQTQTSWADALYKYEFSITNMPRSKQSSLEAFYNQQKGEATPFLMKDPYAKDLVVSVASGVTIAANSGFYLTNNAGRRVIGDPNAMRITSALSGVLTYSTHYANSLENGFIVMAIGKGAADTITVSADYFRKVTFNNLSQQSFLWDSFNGSFSVSEMTVI